MANYLPLCRDCSFLRPPLVYSISSTFSLPGTCWNLLPLITFFLLFTFVGFYPFYSSVIFMRFQKAEYCGSAGEESTCNVEDLGLIPGLGRSPGEGKGYPLQYSGLENSMDCIVLGVAKSWRRLRDFHFTYFELWNDRLFPLNSSIWSMEHVWFPNALGTWSDCHSQIPKENDPLPPSSLVFIGSLWKLT